MFFAIQTVEKISTSIQRVPSIQSLGLSLLLLISVACICVPLGLWVGFLEVRKPSLTLSQIIAASGSRLIFPCFVEELFFRVLLTPSESSNFSETTQLIILTISLFAYVFSHPINAAIFYKRASGVVAHPFFLLSTALLGTACTIAYMESKSIWPPVLIHWIIVLGWLFVLGGYSKLGFSES